MDESVVKEFESQQVGKKLRLSQAIRIGAKLRPQAFGWPFAYGGSCALGAAYEAWYGKTEATGTAVYARLEEDHPNLTLPSACERSYDLMDEIVWRNDEDRHTREQIADWLESQGL